MNALRGVIADFIDFFNIKTIRGLVRLIVLGAATALAFFYLSPEGIPSEDPEESVKAVEVSSIASLSSDEGFELIGTVEALQEAEIQSETAGRVTAVNVALGQSVGAGQVIATLENASQYAAVLQAEGAYEAAQAAAAQSDVGLEEAKLAVTSAKQDAVDTYRSAFSTFRSILLSDVDQLFRDPDNRTPGVLIDAGLFTEYLNEERRAFNDVLEDWQEATTLFTLESDLTGGLDGARVNLVRLIEMVDVFVTKIADGDGTSILTESQLTSIQSQLETDRQILNNQLSSIESTLTGLNRANEALRKAELGSTNTDVSAANATVKQALGALRAAQANFDKTILRTPISGTVNFLEIKTGDFVSSFETVATIANNDAYLINTYLGAGDRDRLSVGDNLLLPSGETATVSTVAPALDPVTRKIKVELQAEDQALKSGDTLTLRVGTSTNSISEVENQPITVPLQAIKFTADAAEVFTVSDGVLVSNPVTTGEVRNDGVRIETGLSTDMVIVVDARGLVAGDRVEAVTQ